MHLFLKHVGTDDWSRDVFQDETGLFYKRYEDDKTLYSASSYYGEPAYSLKHVTYEIVPSF